MDTTNNCNDCELLNSGEFKETGGCPFWKKCFIAKYIEIGGQESYEEIKAKLIEEINSLNIEAMPKINDLNPISGALINEEFLLPNGRRLKLLDDNDIYLEAEVGNVFGEDETNTNYEVIANMSFILIAEQNNICKEIIVYKKR